MISAPLVMPEVILGLSLLLLFVSMSVAARLLDHRHRAHDLLPCATSPWSSSRAWSPSTAASRRRRWIWAPPPLKTFFVITLPIIAPALIGGWLLAFTLSLDDLVVASFTTGPGATTLPMRIYSSVRLGVTPEINAVCTVLIALVTIGRDHRLDAAEAPLRRLPPTPPGP